MLSTAIKSQSMTVSSCSKLYLAMLSVMKENKSAILLTHRWMLFILQILAIRRAKRYVSSNRKSFILFLRMC